MWQRINPVSPSLRHLLGILRSTIYLSMLVKTSRAPRLEKNGTTVVQRYLERQKLRNFHTKYMGWGGKTFLC
jgi:hypothetical protein